MIISKRQQLIEQLQLHYMEYHGKCVYHIHNIWVVTPLHTAEIICKGPGARHPMRRQGNATYLILPSNDAIVEGLMS